MSRHIKYPILFVILILLAYAVSILLWIGDLALGTVLVVFANSVIAALGLIMIGREIANITAIKAAKTKKIIYICINIVCLLIAVVAILIPFISFLYIDIHGF